MINKRKFTVYLIVAIVFTILSVIIFLMADGLRRWYSGAFFTIIVLTSFAKAIYEYRTNARDSR